MQGVANGFTDVTNLPSSLAIASTWDPELAFQFGQANGREHVIKGANVVLCPAINIARIPWCGRLFEYLGEDPTLASAIAPAIVHGLQSNKVSGSVKHYVLNVQEMWRHNVSSNVDRRTFRSVYTPAFEAAVDAGVGSVMCSYNRINGSTWACEDPDLLERDLRGTFGFQGFVRSDGYALWHTEAPALNGCDQEQPSTVYFGPALEAAVAAGRVPLTRLQEMVTRQLTALFATGVMSQPLNYTYQDVATSPDRVLLAKHLATNSTVLLKNDGNFLPLRAQLLHSIALFGDEHMIGGGGSGFVHGGHTVTPIEGLMTLLLDGQPPRREPGPCTTLNDTDFFQVLHPPTPLIIASSSPMHLNTRFPSRTTPLATTAKLGPVPPQLKPAKRCACEKSPAEHTRTAP